VVMTSLVWLLDVEDLKPLYYWELRGARQALAELLRKYGGDLPGHVREAVQIALNDIEVELEELEVDLVSILPDRRPIAAREEAPTRGDGKAEAVVAQG